MIYGVGTDIINIERVEHILNKNRDGFVRRVLSEKKRLKGQCPFTCLTFSIAIQCEKVITCSHFHNLSSFPSPGEGARNKLFLVPRLRPGNAYTEAPTFA